MTDLSMRILQAVKGDSAAIQSLAAAIASHDADGVRAVLSARGVTVGDDELGDLMSRVAGAGDASANVTSTFTYTFT